MGKIRSNYRSHKILMSTTLTPEVRSLLNLDRNTASSKLSNCNEHAATFQLERTDVPLRIDEFNIVYYKLYQVETTVYLAGDELYNFYAPCNYKFDENRCDVTNSRLRVSVEYEIMSQVPFMHKCDSLKYNVRCWSRILVETPPLSMAADIDSPDVPVVNRLAMIKMEGRQNYASYLDFIPWHSCHYGHLQVQLSENVIVGLELFFYGKGCITIRSSHKNLDLEMFKRIATQLYMIFNSMADEITLSDIRLPVDILFPEPSSTEINNETMIVTSTTMIPNTNAIVNNGNTNEPVPTTITALEERQQPQLISVTVSSFVSSSSPSAVPVVSPPLLSSSAVSLSSLYSSCDSSPWPRVTALRSMYPAISPDDLPYSFGIFFDLILLGSMTSYMFRDNIKLYCCDKCISYYRMSPTKAAKRMGYSRIPMPRGNIILELRRKRSNCTCNRADLATPPPDVKKLRG